MHGADGRTRWLDVLLIGDDVAFREEVGIVLEREFTMIALAHGSVAERLLRVERPQAVILDLELGRWEEGQQSEVLSGPALVERIRKALPDCHLLTLSLRGDNALKRSCRGAGADRCLSKWETGGFGLLAELRRLGMRSLPGRAIGDRSDRPP